MSEEELTMQELQKTLDQIDDDQKLIDVKIESLQNQKEDLEQQRVQILTQMESLMKSQNNNNNNSNRYNNNRTNNTSTQNNLRLVQFKGKFKWDKCVQRSLQNKFRLNSFRLMQREIINCTLKKKDCFVILPSGGGKSLCYQLPATLPIPYTNKGITLVVSPLVALMIDQCYQLNKLGIKAGSLHGKDNSRSEHSEIYNDLQSCDNGTEPRFKLIYVTPEKVAKSKKLHNKLEVAYNNDKLDRIVIDEAHCCSQWGHDFRPSYKNLSLLRRQYKNIPILACTATATDGVLNDTVKILRMRDPMIFRGSFNRPNLHYSVRPKPSTKKDAMLEVLRIIRDEFAGDSGIVYAQKVKNCIDLYEYLKANDVSALPYHGQMDNHEREKAQTSWLEDRCQVVVATLAFGLGINKPDVSFVVHYTISQSIQNYYQESGRAGRDGEPSNCILMYRPSDCFSHIAPMIAQRTDAGTLLKPLMEYAHNMNKCRRNVMAKSFNESNTITSQICNGNCDVCDASNDYKEEYKMKDITNDAILINKIVVKTNNKNKKNTLSMPQLVDVWRGSSSSIQGKKLINELNIAKMKTSHFSKAECEYIIGGLFAMGYINIDTRFTAYQAVCVIVPGSRSFSLAEIHRKRNKNMKIMINLPILGKRNRSKLQSARKKAKEKKQRSKSAINSNNNNNNYNDNNNRLNTNQIYNQLSSESQNSQSQNEESWISQRNIKRDIKSEPVNKKKGRKRKRKEMDVLNLCSDSDSDNDNDNEWTDSNEEKINNNNNNNKNKNNKLNTSRWDLTDSDEEYDFAFDEDCIKKKKKKRKSKKKRLSDSDMDMDIQSEPPKRKKRKVSKKNKKNNKKIKSEKGNKENENVQLQLQSKIQHNIDAVPSEYKENSLQYKMYSELHMWNQMNDQPLSNDIIAEILKNLQHVLSEQQIEVERIIGGNKWKKIGKELLKEIRRIRNEYNKCNNKTRAQNRYNQNASVIHNNYTVTNIIVNSPNNDSNLSNVNNVMDDNNINEINNNNNNNNNSMNRNWNNDNMNNNCKPNNNDANRQNVMRNINNNNNSNINNAYNPPNTNRNYNNENMYGNVSPKPKAKQRVITPMKIADSLRNRNTNKSPSLTSSFCPASLVNNNNNINNTPPNIRRHRRKSAPTQHGITKSNNNKKDGQMMMHNSTLHEKLLSKTTSSMNINNQNNNSNDNGFEYPDDSDDISEPQSTESPLLIRQSFRTNKRSISNRTKLKLNFQ